MPAPSKEMPRVVMQGGSALDLPAWMSFIRPLRVISASSIAEVAPALREIERAADNGQWAAGFVSYEAAPAFDAALQVHAPGPLPLLWFGIYDVFEQTEGPGARGRMDGWTGAPSMDTGRYATAFDRIKDLIARGETYQVNMTMRLSGAAPASPWDTFCRLHLAQRGNYSAFVETDEFALCSASPELFFQLNGAHILCQPMKGTAARGRWLDEDEARGSALQTSAKDRAENVMIVDMVRNDLGRIAKAGSVRTTSLFDVQRLPTVWQMTSTVEAATQAPVSDIFAALFPCASVTGAPKVQTMSIIRSLEDSPRGVYTGAIGFIGPGRMAQFNVAIRTLEIDKALGQAHYGTGSGVVWDSDAAREYEECGHKAMVLKDGESFHLLTTLLWRTDGGFQLLPRHLTRLDRAARYFGFRFDPEAVHEALSEQAKSFVEADGDGAPSPRTDGLGAGRLHQDKDRRIRVLVDEQGHVDVEVGPAPPPSPGPRRVALADRAVTTDDPFLFHKTSRRRLYDDRRASRPDCDDVILWNERGEVTESTICNIAIRRNGAWITPPVSCGLLAGVMREEMLARGELVEGVITRDEFLRAGEIVLFNAVRGRMPAVVVP